MAQKLLPPNISLWWVPIPAGIDDIDAPTVDEINAGINLSCAIAVGYTLEWAERDTDDSRTICDDSNVQNPTLKNYNGDITFFLDADFNDNTSVFNLAMDTFDVPLQNGLWVQRIGKTPNDFPDAEVGDRVTVFEFLSGDPNIINDGDAPVQMQVVFYPQGRSSNGIVTVVAAGAS